MITLQFLSHKQFLVKIEICFEGLEPLFLWINAGSFAFVPGYVKELNELTKTPEGRKELLKRVWGDDWEKHA